jgi:electron transport complex protein RnfD
MENTILSSSPHIRHEAATARIMLDVVIALVPAGVAGVITFGLNAAITIALAVAAAVLTEALIQLATKKKVTVNDWSAAVTGLIVAYNITPTAPWYLPVLGSVFAIAIVKQVFGGLGHNFMNPAAAARVFLATAFSVQMTNWPVVADAVSNATPLAILKGFSTDPLPSVTNMLTGNHGGCIGETCAAALILGGVYLLVRRVITWHIPVAFIGTVGILTFVFGPEGLFTGNVVYHLLGGGLLLGSIFMATDYVTSPVSPKGRIIMGVGCGAIVTVIRLLGGMAEGVAFSIILMNIATPMIDRFTRPRIYGEVKDNA